jgi:hypothetical protein
MQTTFLSISQVATLLGIRKHRIEYALSERLIPEPKLRFLGKRAFDPAEVCIIASHFGKDNKGGESRSPSSS